MLKHRLYQFLCFWHGINFYLPIYTNYIFSNKTVKSVVQFEFNLSIDTFKPLFQGTDGSNAPIFEVPLYN